MSSSAAASLKSEAVGEDDGVSARRKKKRELDRRCQRISRDRTKTRIMELEKMVEELSRPDINAHIAFLTQQLAVVRKERDELSKTMANIATLSRRNAVDDSSEVQSDGLGPEDGITIPAEVIPPVGDPLWHGHPQNVDSLANLGFNSSNFDPGITAPLIMHAPTLAPSVPMPTGMRVETNLARTQVEKQRVALHTQALDFYFPANCTVCEYDTAVPEPPPNKPPNLWRFANHVLTRPEMGEDTASDPVGDTVQENVAVRAVLDGWDSLGSFEQLSPSWQKLRLIDEQLFSTCAKVERLAILRIMHKNILLDADPSPERLANMPPWYLKRPSQSIIDHAYAIDFFAWPGMRERFVFFEHKYCGNIFWKLFCSSFPYAVAFRISRLL